MMERSVPGNDAYAVFAAHGFHLLRKHYYVCLPDDDDLRFIQDSELVGVTVKEGSCIEFYEKNVEPFNREFRSFALDDRAQGEDGYSVVNGTFMAVDGNMYYGLIRQFAPNQIVEVGSGNSTKLAAAAIRMNAEEGKNRTELVCIEPFHSEPLRRIDEVSKIIESAVQEVDLKLFESLGENDILFLDSTHTVRPGGDVWWEYCEILPRLRPGVFVHVHDVSLPKSYPKMYFHNHWYWMEQYMLQAFLAFNDRFEVVWPGNLLMTRQPDRMKRMHEPEYTAVLTEYPDAEPTSFWMRVVSREASPGLSR